MVPAAGVVAAVQLGRALGHGALAALDRAPALGAPPLAAGQVEPGGRRRQVPPQHAPALQVHHGRPSRVRLHEGHHSLSAGYV